MRRVRITAVALATLALVFPMHRAAFAHAPETGLHDLHATQSRVLVEGKSIRWRVRCFGDDLEKALRAFSKRPQLVLAGDARADSLFGAYFNARVSVAAGGTPLRAVVLQSGHDADPAGGSAYWYDLQLIAARPSASLSVRNALLFEQFNDQQNLVTVVFMPSAARHALYFSAADDKAQVLRPR